MTNLNTLIGFGAGGGAGGDLPAAFTDTATLVDSASQNMGGNTQSISAKQYNMIHPLATDGLFGGIADCWHSTTPVNSALYAVSFLVNTSNGSIGTINHTKDPSSNLYTNSSTTNIFSTCHIGSVGNVVMYQGHALNPSSAPTRKGYSYGVKYNTDGSVAQAGHGYGDEGNGDNWPHSDGEIAMGTDSNDSNVYGRRSCYYSPTGKYYHSCNHWGTSGASIGNQEHTANSNYTSTNYLSASAKQSKDDRTPGGFIYWYGANGVNNLTEIYGTSASRSSDLEISAQQFTPAFSLRMSTGKSVRIHNGTVIEGQGNGNAPVDITSTADDSIHLLTKIGAMTWSQSMCKPTKNADEWILGVTNYGLIKFNIDVNDNYKTTITKQIYTDVWGHKATTPAYTNHWGLVGPNDEYFCFSSWSGSTLNVKTYENPLL
tara:strand:- start:486 stop:1775 length:1290 start_codon:yes stop_codon:yes gene_type:complete